MRVSHHRNYKFDFKMNESEYVKLKKAAWLGNVTMAEFIRDALNAKYSKMTEQEIRRNDDALQGEDN